MKIIKYILIACILGTGFICGAMVANSEVEMSASVEENPCNRCLKYCNMPK